MKLNILDESHLPRDFKKENIFNGKRIVMDIKHSKSFVIIKNNLVEYVEKYDISPVLLEEELKPTIIRPIAHFDIIKLSKHNYIGHQYSPYQIKVDYLGLKQWRFIDLNWWKYFKLQFNADKTWINKSNIHRVIFLVMGGIIGFLLTLLGQKLIGR